ncbi:cellulase family glycosylhydrolase [uncultured Ruminococcus sp.]|uniref:cellulase family glycosylhydrolase n=1 Tax=uncultured Ruminococcus sp. TaxID=165186 RepID=UPI0025FF7C77|nr:cellulase family glycosylhydrolase [uncultured Ruminococcus sp.]
MNGGISKKIIAAFVALAAVIITLVVLLVVTNFGGGEKSDNDTPAGSSSASSKAESKGDDSEDDSSEADDSEESSEEEKEDSDADSSEEEEDDSTEDDNVQGYLFTWSGGNGWVDGDKQMSGLEMSITNKSGEAVSGWTLELEIEDLKSCDGWNGTFKTDGNKLTITNADYNGDIANGASVTCGCNIGTGKELNIKSAKLNGTECTIKKGKVSQNSGNNNNNNNGDQNAKKDVDVKSLLARSKDAEQGDDWLHTDGSKILDKDGKEVWLTGVNWFGYNTGTNIFDGLWNSEFEPTIKAIADHGFNLIRVPMSAELINQWAAGEYPQANYNNAYNEELNSMNSLEIFDYFLKLAEQNGMKVMPDIHSANTDAAGHNANLWYTDRVSVKEYYAALEWLADRYKDNDTIIAFDLKNEPHGKPNEGDQAAIWNDSKDANNWKYVAETAAGKVLAKNPNVLIMVEGIEIYPKDIKKNGDYKSQDNDDYYFNWWGGNLRGVKDYPIDLGKHQDKLVYSPHDYGPTVYEQPWFEGGYDFKSLKKDCWQDNWLYIKDDNIAPLLIGEWGGFMTEPNITWMTHMRKLIKDNHLNHTFWCFNANSGDTGGLVLDDFTTWDDEKYEFVKEVLWQEGGKFVGLDHKIKLGENGITLSKAKGL